MLYRLPDKTGLVIGDFGISSALEEGFSKHLTDQARTNTYAAPEVFQSIRGNAVIGKEVDYYSLGISLIHL
jgi:serine/threonine protein kinase